MIKNSKQLIAAENAAMRRELERCLERGTQPSYTEMYFEGYAEGYNDGSTANVVELSAEITRLRELTTWVDVNERLPEECKEVLILVKYGNEEEWTDIWMGNYEVRKSGITWYSSQSYGHWRVVAWMPMPDMPEGSKSNNV